MNIWLIQTGEPLPTDGKNDRLLRMGILADLLVAGGHTVTWWASDFNHVRKIFRVGSDATLKVNAKLQIKLLHSIGYKKIISFQRILNHYGVAKKFAILARKETPPDLILCSFPLIELSLEATKYGRDMKVPVVLDVRDCWPDSFLDLLPVWLHWAGKIFLWPMFRNAARAFRQAYAISGASHYLAQWGVEKAKRKFSSLDRSFPFGYISKAPQAQELQTAEAFWDKVGIGRSDGWQNICFFGTIGYQIDLETIIEAARMLQEQNTRVRFILCGHGDKLNLYKEKAADCKNIIFAGWVGFPEIWVLMRRSAMGLVPYKPFKQYQGNFPNKVIEYLSAGLPILSSLEGLMEELILAYQCGFMYKNGDAKGLTLMLQKIYPDHEIIKKVSDNALALYKEKFTAEKVYAEMSNYLQEVVRAYAR